MFGACVRYEIKLVLYSKERIVWINNWKTFVGLIRYQSRSFAFKYISKNIEWNYICLDPPVYCIIFLSRMINSYISTYHWWWNWTYLRHGTFQLRFNLILEQRIRILYSCKKSILEVTMMVTPSIMDHNILLDQFVRKQAKFI